MKRSLVAQFTLHVFVSRVYNPIIIIRQSLIIYIRILYTRLEKKSASTGRGGLRMSRLYYDAYLPGTDRAHSADGRAQPRLLSSEYSAGSQCVRTYAALF
jgi:hypothetical protein